MRVEGQGPGTREPRATVLLGRAGLPPLTGENGGGKGTTRCSWSPPGPARPWGRGAGIHSEAQPRYCPQQPADLLRFRGSLIPSAPNLCAEVPGEWGKG